MPSMAHQMQKVIWSMVSLDAWNRDTCLKKQSVIESDYIGMVLIECRWYTVLLCM